MLITTLFVRSPFWLKGIVLSTNVAYPIDCPFVFLTYDYCVVHQCCLTYYLNVRLFCLKLLCWPPMLITPLFVHSSFLLKVIVLSTNADYPIICPFVLFT